VGDVTERVLMIFAHPTKHTEKEPYLVAVRLLNYLKYGPPTTKKGKAFLHLETHLMQ
jgi:hypothetical protein